MKKFKVLFLLISIPFLFEGCNGQCLEGVGNANYNRKGPWGEINYSHKKGDTHITVKVVSAASSISGIQILKGAKSSIIPEGFNPGMPWATTLDIGVAYEATGLGCDKGDFKMYITYHLPECKYKTDKVEE